MNLSMSEHGALKVIDRVLWYYDLETGNKTILCNKPNCNHQPFSYDFNPDPSCNAVLKSGHFAAYAIYENDIYIFADEGINDTTVYKQRIDGTGREVLAKLNWGVNAANSVYFQDYHAYFTAEQLIVDEEGQANSSDQKLAIVGLDLRTGKLTILSEIRHDHLSAIQGPYLYEEKLVYHYVYLDEQMDLNLAAVDWDEYVRSFIQYMNSYVYEIDLNTQEEILKMNTKEHIEALIHLVDDQFIYTLSDDFTDLIAVNTSDYNKEVLFTGDHITHFTRTTDGIIIWQSAPHPVYYYNLSSSKLTKLDRPVNESYPVYSYGDWVITNVYSGEDRQYRHDVGILWDDYIKGKPYSIEFSKTQLGGETIDLNH